MRALIRRGDATGPLVMVGDDGTEKTLTMDPTTGAALATRWDGALCAAWVTADEHFHASCAPSWTSETATGSVEHRYGELALTFPTKACSPLLGGCIDHPYGLALHSDVAIGAVIGDAGTWRPQELFVSSISFFGGAVLVGGRPWACATAPLGNAAILGEDVESGDLDLVWTDPARDTDACAIATDGSRVYSVSRDGIRGALYAFDGTRQVGTSGAGEPLDVSSVDLSFELRGRPAIVATATGAILYHVDQGALAAQAYDRGSSAVTPVAAPPGMPTTGVVEVATTTVGTATDVVVTTSADVWAARTCAAPRS